MKVITFVFFSIFLFFHSIYARTLDESDSQLNPLLTLSPGRIEGAIQLDGLLEESWQKAAHFENFAEFMPAQYLPAKVGTEGYIAYNESNLYVALVCYDPQIRSIRASVTDRDKIFNDDFAGIIIDTYRDRQRAYEFFCNPHGVQADLIWQSNLGDDDPDLVWQANGGEEISFDTIWHSESKIYDDKWIVEMEIPFSSLRYPNKEEQNWAIHFIRVYPRDNRYQFSWMPISHDNNSFMGQAGNLEISTVGPAVSTRAIEIMPYIIRSQQGSLVDDDFDERGEWQRQDAENRIGFNLKYGLASNSILDFTYNPDFSQIESDAGQIDINEPLALFFPERRPFFMEGSDIFNIGSYTRGLNWEIVANLIYTRSINDPLVAGKVSGKSGKISYGFISAKDKNTPFILPHAEGSLKFPTDYDSWSNILRIKYDVAERSYVGLAVTNRNLEDDGSNTVAAIDASIRLSEKHTIRAVGGMTYTEEPVDTLLSQSQGMFSVPDFKVGDRTETMAFDGGNFYGRLFKLGFIRQARHWNASLVYFDYSPGFRAGNGFIATNNERTVSAWSGYSFRFDDHKVFSIIEPQFAVWRSYNYDGHIRRDGIKPVVRFRFQRQTNLFLGAGLFFREEYKGIKFDDERYLELIFVTNIIKQVSAQVVLHDGVLINRFGEIGNPRNPLDGVPAFQIDTGLNFRPADQIENKLEYSYFHLKTEDGNLIVKQKILRDSFSYQFSKQLFIRLIAELNWVEQFSGTADNTLEIKYFSIEPLLSFKLNPFTVFFLGANIGGQDDPPYRNYEGLTRTNQNLFVKFQYLWQI